MIVISGRKSVPFYLRTMPVSLLTDQDKSLTILQSIFTTAIDGIFLINEDGTIVMCNEAGHTLFGYREGELVGKNISILMPSPHAQQHKTYVSNYLHTRRKRIIGIGREIEGLRKDGTIFSARLAVSEITIDDNFYFTGIIHDLTEIKKAEHELSHLNQELEKMVVDRTSELQDAINRLLDTNLLLNRAIEKHKASETALLSTRDELKRSLEKEIELSLLKSRFISMASHEFKTPLSSILSSAALISRYTYSQQQPDRERHVERIKSSVSHLNTILTDFLSAARLEEGQLTPKSVSFLLDELFDELKEELAGLLKTGQQMLVHYRFNHLMMRTDKNIVRNILYNVISNAIKYSGENSQIDCQINRRGNAFVISIRDEGIGIPKSERKFVGTRFFRASNVSHLQGTGLGLNIVRSYLHALKGKITLKSHEKGTTFTLTIPAEYES